MVWALNEYQIRGADVKWLAWVLTMFAGLTMVSNLKYYSGKDINPRRSVSFPAVVAIALAVVALVAVSSTLPEMLFILFLCYALSGYALAAWDLTKRNRGGRPPSATGS
jgi:CDP-diacylglycerol--serine O-phosphatidyltransferase